MAPTQRKKRRSLKCTSCRRLKIMCDLAKPSCEYCIATKRQCVYDDDEIPKDTNDRVPDSSANVFYGPEVSKYFVNSEGRGSNAIWSLFVSHQRAQVANVTEVLSATAASHQASSNAEQWPNFPSVTPLQSSESSSSGELMAGSGDVSPSLYVEGLFSPGSVDGSLLTSPGSSASSTYISASSTHSGTSDTASDNGSFGDSDIDDVVKSTATPASNLSVSLNAMSKQLNITRFEYRLIKYFHEGYLLQSINNNQFDQSMHHLSTDLFKTSMFFREVVYALLGTALYLKCDFQQLVEEDKDDIDCLQPESQILLKISNNDELRNALYVQILKFYERCLQESQRQFSHAMESDSPVENVEKSMELVFSFVFFFCFFMNQPFGIIRIFSPTGEPDVIGFACALRMLLCPAVDKLKNDGYNDLLVYFYEECNLAYHKFEGHFLVEHLRNNLHQLRNEGLLNKANLIGYKMALIKFDQCFTVAGQLNNASGIHRFVFMLEDGAYEGMRNEEYFGMKIVYMYCCVTFITGLTHGGESFIVSEFLEYYKQLNLSRFGRWYDPIDEDLYDLVKVYHFVLPFDDFRVLKTFNPSEVLKQKIRAHDTRFQEIFVGATPVSTAS